ncbi:MAG: TIGR00730 family Rossman fold protein, partial [Bacteroidetes bacterium]
QLGFTKKPIGILNINGFYDSLFTLLDNMVKEKLLLQPHREMLLSSESPKELISMMNNYKAPVVGKWIQKIIEEN